MDIQNIEQWEQIWNNMRKVLYVVLGEGSKQDEVYAAAERQAVSSHRVPVWVKSKDVIDHQDDLNQMVADDYISCTVCLQRHIVEKYMDSDLLSDELDLIVDEGYIAAEMHSHT